MFRAATGHLPFNAPTLFGLLMRHVNDEAPRLRAVDPSVPPFDILRPSQQGPCPIQPGDDCLVVHPADYFIDGNMWTLTEYRGQLHEVREIDQIEAFFDDLWNQSEAP